MPTFAGLSHIVLNAKDSEATADWYQRYLGFIPVGRFGGTVTAFHRDSKLLLVVNTASMQRAEPKAQALEHFALVVTDRDELVRWHDHLGVQGIDNEIKDEPIGSSITMFDPDGTEIELFVRDKTYGSGTVKGD